MASITPKYKIGDIVYAHSFEWVIEDVFIGCGLLDDNLCPRYLLRATNYPCEGVVKIVSGEYLIKRIKWPTSQSCPKPPASLIHK